MNRCSKNQPCKKDKCKPVCSPCKTQGKIKYCGEDVACIGIKSGQDVDDIIKLFADIICDLKAKVDVIMSTMEIDYGGDVNE